MTSLLKSNCKLILLFGPKLVFAILMLLQIQKERGLSVQITLDQLMRVKIKPLHQL